MDWNTAAAFYLARLPGVFEVQKRALALAQLPQASVSDAQRQALGKPVEPLRRQYDRLKKNEFRIAVVGLEKAGKSTFVNAWLGADLLPNDMKRCTFTTTQIFSVVKDSEQRLEVEARSPAQFEQLVNDLEAQAREKGEAGQRARADLDTIRKHRANLDKVVAEKTIRHSFSRLEDVAEPLWKYVADESNAHAVLEARLHTSRLASAEGIVFFDVPGLNSGLAKHVEESEQMLKDCDAVILIQDSQRPNLEANEQKLIQFMREGDEVVGIAGKLFVFFGRIDKLGSPEALQQARTEALHDWHVRGKLPADRLVPGSAAAYLLLIQRAGEKLNSQTGGLSRVQPNLEHITGASGGEGLKRATGIPVIKERINHYLQHERIDVLHRRCREPMRALLETARQIFDQVRKRFPEDPEEAKRAEDRRREIEFSIWWKDHWVTILADVNGFFENHFLRSPFPETAAGERAIDSFRCRYRQEIEKRLPTLRSRKMEEIKKLIGAYSPPGDPNPSKFNMTWREQLSEEVRILIEWVSGELALELRTDATALLDRMSTLLWGSKEVQARLGEERPNFQTELEGKLKTLFLRFARPVVSVLVRAPLASHNREHQIKRLSTDIELLDNYYPTDKTKERAYSQLKSFARYGRELLTNNRLRRKVLGTDDVPDDANGEEKLVEVRESSANNEVLNEVEADLKALEVYLLDAVYAASGFEGFYEEELRSLKDWFINQEGAWAGVARNENMAGNPRLLEILPPGLQGQSYDTEVSDRLRQLRIALETADKQDGLSLTP